jgi:hypothetical protein
MGQQNLARLQYNSRSVFFDIDNEYAFLEPRDVIQVASSGTKQETAFAALTHRLKCPVSKLYERHPHLQWELQERLGRVPDLAELCTCLSSSSYTRLSWTKPEPDETTRSACAMWRLERLEAVLGRLGIERIGGTPAVSASNSIAFGVRLASSLSCRDFRFCAMALSGRLWRCPT